MRLKIMLYLMPIMLFLSCSNEEIVNKIISSGDKFEIRVYAGQVDNVLMRSGNASNLDENETIDRVDVFVYNEDGTLFEYIQPTATDKAGEYVALLTKDVVTDTRKDVFILANYDASKIDELQDLKSLEMQNLVANSIQKQNGDIFEGPHLLSVSKLGHLFDDKRVLEIELTRIYSKLTLTCSYNYKNDDVESSGQNPIKPMKIAVLIDSLVNISQDVSIFPDSHVVGNPNLTKYIYATGLPLHINGKEINGMHETNATDSLTYDFFTGEPNLMLFPHTVENGKTVFGLKFKLYDELETPLLEFSKLIEIPAVEYNKDYHVKVYFNQLDKPKSRNTYSKNNRERGWDCSYEVTTISR